ncbi:2'-5' RNA ligase [Sphingobium sp. AP49]|uniref:2'-5' RNA ligase family protein n=1 Tax=Sphingobium sp. AP49 TaxID=1144307 RepID=UPI00026EDF05|nr:2'-5' RNA ligase family protein [Sphingobium sp. AP49]WHO39788.1 2'-5' RNA ligase [Sphingobium sp. AP49]
MSTRTAPHYRLIVALKPPTIITRQIDHFAETIAPDADRIRPAHQHITMGITDDWRDYPYTLVKALHRSFTTIMAEPFNLSLDQLSEGGRSTALRPGHALPPLKDLQRKIAVAMKRAGVGARLDWKFSPHQTLYYRDASPATQRISGFHWRVEDFVLICSHVGHTHHEMLGRWPLRGSDQYSLF